MGDTARWSARIAKALEPGVPSTATRSPTPAPLTKWRRRERSVGRRDLIRRIPACSTRGDSIPDRHARHFLATADGVGEGRIRFEIAGGRYRLIVAFDFARRVTFVKFLGSHAEYDRIDAATVSQY